MSKKERILRLYDGQRSTREIAKLVGCLPEYVRVVARQRKGGSYSVADLNYRTRASARQRAAYQAGSIVVARLAYQKTILRLMHNDALTPNEVTLKARNAYTAARIKDGRKRLGVDWYQEYS